MYKENSKWKVPSQMAKFKKIFVDIIVFTINLSKEFHSNQCYRPLWICSEETVSALRLQYEEQLLKNTCSCAIGFSLACHDYESWIDTQHPVFSFQSIEHVHGKSWLVFLSGRNFNKLKQILYWLSDLKQDISDKPTQSKVGSKVFNDWIYISQFYNKVTVDIRR